MADRDRLWREYKNSGNEEARDTLIIEYAYLAKYAVDRLNLSPSGALSYDDLVGHAVVGLIDALEKFDPTRLIKFETYALTRIRGEVIDVIRSLDWTPRSVRRNGNVLRDAFAMLEVSLERPPSDLEVADYLGLTICEFEKMLADVGQSALMSLDEIITSGGEISGSSANSDFDDPAQRAQSSEQKRLLANAIDELPDREKTVVSLYYYENLTQREIALVLGVTESRICQIHTKAVLRLAGKLSRASVGYSMAA